MHTAAAQRGMGYSEPTILEFCQNSLKIFLILEFKYFRNFELFRTSFFFVVDMHTADSERGMDYSEATILVFCRNSCWKFSEFWNFNIFGL